MASGARLSPAAGCEAESAMATAASGKARSANDDLEECCIRFTVTDPADRDPLRGRRAGVHEID
jgi:hypothetical protein